MKALPSCLIISILSLAILGMPNVGFAQEEIVIKTCLFGGFNEGNKFDSRPMIIPSDEHLVFPWHYDVGRLDGSDIDYFKEVISSVYRIPYVFLLTSANLVWDGKSATLQETIQDDINILPIQLLPDSLSPNSINLGIVSSKLEIQKMSYWKEMARLNRAVLYGSDFDLFINAPVIKDILPDEFWLNKKFTLPFGQTLLITLPTETRSLFLLIQASRRNDRRMDVGLIGNRIFSCSIGSTDPVCGMKVGRGAGYAPKDAPKALRKYRDRTYFFCSEDCRTKFDQDPENFLKKIAEFLEQHEIWKKKTASKPGAISSSQPRTLMIPGFDEDSRWDKLSHSIEVEADVDDLGNVHQARIVNSDAAQYDNLVQETIKRWTFDPKVQEGKSVSAQYPIKVKLAPNDRPQQDAKADRSESTSLDYSIRERISVYCEKLEKTALNFICRERIEETLGSSRERQLIELEVDDPFHPRFAAAGVLVSSREAKREEHSFFHDYQLIRKEDQIQERRRSTDEKGRDLPKDKPYPQTHRFYIDKSVFGPVGLFGHEVQSRFQYQLLGEEKSNGRPAYVVEIKPLHPVSGKTSYGKAWIDRQDASVLKMDIDAESLSGYERIAADYISRGVSPDISIEVIYGYEKNGLRFPSQINLKEAYSDPKQGRIKMSQLRVDYDQYKFFTVGTEVKY
jgi:TonB family protein